MRLCRREQLFVIGYQEETLKFTEELFIKHIVLFFHPQNIPFDCFPASFPRSRQTATQSFPACGNNRRRVVSRPPQLPCGFVYNYPVPKRGGVNLCQ